MTGPYVDKAGLNLMGGGGTLLVQGNTTVHASGHNAVIAKQQDLQPVPRAERVERAPAHIAEIAGRRAGPSGGL